MAHDCLPDNNTYLTDQRYRKCSGRAVARAPSLGADGTTSYEMSVPLLVALPEFCEEGFQPLLRDVLTTPEVASISGHPDPRVLFRYSHPMRQRMLQVIDRAWLKRHSMAGETAAQHNHIGHRITIRLRAGK